MTTKQKQEVHGIVIHERIPDGKAMFNFIIEAADYGQVPEGHFSTYLDDHFDFTGLALALEVYVQNRIVEALLAYHEEGIKSLKEAQSHGK